MELVDLNIPKEKYSLIVYMDNDREKFKIASENAINMMSKFGKQFVNEALEHSEPFFDILNNVKNDLTNVNNVNNEKKINKHITILGDTSPFSKCIGNSENYVLIFNLPGVNKKDLNVEKQENLIQINCKTSIGDSNNVNVTYDEKEYDFWLDINFNIDNSNILAELKDGCLKIKLDKPIVNKKKDSVPII